MIAAGRTAGAGAFRGTAVVLLGLLIFMTVLNVGMGPREVSALVTPARALRVISRHVPVLGNYVTPLSGDLRTAGVEEIVWNIRVPRALVGAVIGMLLAMAGVAFQGLLLNPLADPYMVGVSAGSALGAALIITLGGAALLDGFAQPLCAFAAGLIALLIVYRLSSIGGRLSSQTFLLSGIVVGTFLWSAIPLMLSISRSEDRRAQILSQLLGNLERADWRALGLLLPFAAIGGMILYYGAGELDLMAQGEETATHLGVDTQSFTRRILIAGSLVTAAAVSVAGIIAFVGMVVPHIARRMVGPKHTALIPTAMLLGGLVLVVSDWLSRVFLGQLEVGVITSLLGAPVFCILLRRRMIQAEA